MLKATDLNRGNSHINYSKLKKNCAENKNNTMSDSCFKFCMTGCNDFLTKKGEKTYYEILGKKRVEIKTSSSI